MLGRPLSGNLFIPMQPGPVNRILVVKWSALGDVVIATALFEDIARSFPNAEIHLNTLPNCVGLFQHDPRFSEIWAIDVRSKRSRLRNSLAWLARSRAGRYDMVIDLQRTDHTRALIALWWMGGGAPRVRVGNLGGFPYTVQPRVLPRPTHAFDMMREAVRAVGVRPVTVRPVLYSGVAAKQRVQALFREHGLDDFAVLLPGSQAAGWLKRWGVENYRALADLLHRTGVHRIAVIGGPDEVEDCQAIAEAGEYVVNLNGALQLLDIPLVCAHARVVVGNDTGTAHFASASGRPMLIVCGATDPRRVRPLGDSVRALQADLPCINCYGKDCSNHDYLACMRVLTPQRVFDEVIHLMEPSHPVPDRQAYRVFEQTGDPSAS
ncbi:MAG TPA: glycosyltransferase family 9 protein [Thiobacillus sp.]|nr:glycosyltransferase family 9 protein [Thiobacillus sp.]